MRSLLSKSFIALLFIGFLASCNEDTSILAEMEDLKTNTTPLVVNENLQSVNSINDIQNWTGTGNNRSALTFQWVTASDIENPTDDEIHFLAWGYRWTSGATGIDMVKAIAKKDTRLYVILGNNFGGVTIKGFGYDGNNDGKIKISNSSLTLTEKDFVNGIYQEKNGDNLDGMKTSSPEDLWMGGWYEAYASYWLGWTDATTVPDGFDYSQYLVDQRSLANNSWDAWTFSTINSAEYNVDPKPELLKAAPNN